MKKLNYCKDISNPFNKLIYIRVCKDLTTFNNYRKSVFSNYRIYIILFTHENIFSFKLN